MRTPTLSAGNGSDDGDVDDSDDGGAGVPNARAIPNVGLPRRARGNHDDAYRTGELWMSDFDEIDGPLIHDQASSVADIYSDMLTGGNPGGADDVVEVLVTETNRYAQQFKDDNPTNPGGMSWNPVDRDTMKAFIAIILYMGLVRLPTLRMYWSTHWMFSFSIAEIMSRNDFLAILRFLHCANNADMIARNLPAYDRLFKIRKVTDMFVKNWQRCFYPSREISLDECIVGFKGRTYLKQYNPKKPHKWGICMWSVADAKSGYTYGWQIFAGKGHHVLESGKGVTYDIVMNSLRENALLDKGWSTWTISFHHRCCSKTFQITGQGRVGLFE